MPLGATIPASASAWPPTTCAQTCWTQCTEFGQQPNGPNPAPRHQHGITSNAGSAQAAPCGSTSADQVVKMSSGRNADTRKLGTSTSWLTLRSTATLQMAYAC